jgi:hypothetical protein
VTSRPRTCLLMSDQLPATQHMISGKLRSGHAVRGTSWKPPAPRNLISYAHRLNQIIILTLWLHGTFFICNIGRRRCWSATILGLGQQLADLNFRKSQRTQGRVPIPDVLQQQRLIIRPCSWLRYQSLEVPGTHLRALRTRP